MAFGFQKKNEIPKSPKMDFKLVEDGFNAVQDDGNILKMLPFVKIPDERYVKFLGIFGRVVNDGGSITCYQYLFVWNGQLFPPHPMDYEPVLVFTFGSNKRKLVLFDKLHYKVGKVWQEVSYDSDLKVVYPWHSFREPKERMFRMTVSSDFRNLTPTIEPLTDSHIQHWRNLSDVRARLLMYEDIVDPHNLIGSNSFRSEKVPIHKMLLAWIKYPFFSACLQAFDLGKSLKILFDKVVQVARAKLNNPGYKEIAAGALILTSLLEEYGLITIEPSIESVFERYYFPGTSNKGLFLEERNLLSEWTPASIISTEEGQSYFTDLKQHLFSNARLKSESKPWIDNWWHHIDYKQG